MERAQLIDLIVRMRPEYSREKLEAVKGNKALEIVLDTIRLSDKHRDDFRPAPPVKDPRPAVSYKHRLRQAVGLRGARLEEERGGDRLTLRIEAPPGFHWSCREVHELVIIQGYGETESAAYEEALGDVEHGLTECDYKHSHDCREWNGRDENGLIVI